jgi:hypothetical protein
MTTNTNIQRGSIVGAQGRSDIERIVGIVTDEPDQGGANVLWLSTTRGAFTCWEALVDLDLGPLNERGLGSDPLVDHLKLAVILDGLDGFRACEVCGALAAQDFCSACGSDQEAPDETLNPPCTFPGPCEGCD